MDSTPAISDMKRLSVVVASQESEATIAKCLTSLDRQRADGSVEIIVVDNSSDSSSQIVAQRFPGVKLVKVPGSFLIPELWAQGLARAIGGVIAFTTAHCIPDARWLSEIMRHHETEHAAIGGAIENMRPSTLTQWAIYFARYAPYMLPFAPHSVDQIPGDNASYKRSILDADLIKDGFWETDVNHRLRQRGHSLLLTPFSTSLALCTSVVTG